MPVPPLPLKDRVILVLLFFFLAVAFSFELYWITHAHRLVELSKSDTIAYWFSFYGECDTAYYEKVSPLALTLEGVNVYFTQALNGLLVWAILKRKPYRHALQLTVASYLSYSVMLYFLETHVGGYAHMRSISTYTYVLFYGVNLPWLLGHLYMVYDSYVTVTRQFRVAARYET